MIRRIAWTVAMIGVIACSSNSNDTVAVMTGTYTATSFTTTINGQAAVNQLTNGSSLSITINSDGSTTGQLVLVGGAEGGGNLTASMAGTWTQSGSTLTLTQSADTFVRDLTFTITGNKLIASATFTDSQLQVTLTRSGS
jgi:hypothetical protein